MSRQQPTALHTFTNSVLSVVSGPHRGLLLYGSQARGDATSDSDIDILQLVDQTPRAYRNDPYSFTAYTPRQLKEMVRGGSLFAWHLAIEGVPLHDPDGDLRDALALHPGPDANQILSRVRDLSPVLDIAQSDFEGIRTRIIRIAQFLLRSAVYAHAIRIGYHSFSLNGAIAHIGLADSAGPLFAVPPNNSDWHDFQRTKQLLGQLVGRLHRNPYVSLDALAVQTADSDSTLSSLAIQSLIDENTELDYATLPPPII